MAIPDRARARHYLAHLNYYRLGAYWLPFEADHDTHTFKPGTNFESVLGLYVFDRELRLLVMDAIERFEVSIRTQWAYHLAHAHGPHAYLDSEVFLDRGKYARCLSSLQDELDRSDEVFIAHYRKTYSDPPHPPLWVVVEVMSLGQLSKWYANLKYRRDRNKVAEMYGMGETIVVSFLHHLTIVRNICAHHSRLWNRQFGFQAKMPRHPAHLSASLNPTQPKRLYNTLVILEYLMNQISPDHRWKARLIKLFEGHPGAMPALMGFPDDWRRRPVWTERALSL